MKTVIFDIDGTLADIEHRRHYVTEGRSYWEKFNAEMGGDTPNLAIVSYTSHYGIVRPMSVLALCVEPRTQSRYTLHHNFVTSVLYLGFDSRHNAVKLLRLM